MSIKTPVGAGEAECGAPRHHFTGAVARASALVLALIPLALTPSPASAATTYVVSQGDAACSDAGPGSSAAPFCSITAATKKAVSGDVISVRAGDYHEQVAPGSGVTVTAGLGASVSGTDDLSSASWSAESAPTTFSTVLGPLAQPTVAAARGATLTKAATISAMTTGSWYYEFATRKLYVDLGSNQPPGASDRVEVGRSYGVRVTAGPAVVDGLDVSAAHVAGILVRDVTGSRVTRLTVSDSRGYGIFVSGGSGNTISQVRVTNNTSVGVRLADATNTSVLDSEADHNSNHGVSVAGGSGNTVAGVVSHENISPPGSPRVATGIDVSKSAAGPSFDVLVERNTTYRNADSGIEIYQGSERALVRRNLSYDNGDHGIDISFSPSARVVSNTVVGNATPGINVEGGSTGVSVRDNIAVDNAIGAPGTQGDIRVDAQSVSGTTLDRDLVHQSSGSPTVIEWAGTDYSTLAAFRAAQPTQERRGIQADPRFVALASRDLGLTIDSPAVDAADADADGWTDADRQGKAPVDQPTVTNSGRGAPAYADLGALELAQGAPPQDAQPVAAINATPGSPLVGQTVTLDASASSDDRGIVSYAFDCGNGVTTGPQASSTTTCVYDAAGTFKAAVTVADTAGQVSSAGVDVKVAMVPDSAPVAKLKASPGSPLVGQTVTLDASASSDDRGIASYAFDCGNGVTTGPQASSTTTCVYDAAGTFKAAVTVADTAGQVSSAGVDVKVAMVPDSAPVAKLKATPGSPLVGQTVTLDASASSDDRGIVSYAFDCGNGVTTGPQASSTTTCVYDAAATFKAAVTVADTAGQSDQATASIIATTSPGPHAVLEVSQRVVRQREPVTLDANGSSAAPGTQIVAYWFSCNVGRRDPVKRPDATITCSYRRPGTYRTGVAVFDDQGAYQVVLTSVRVKRGAAPHARFTLSTRHPRAGQAVVVETDRSTGSTTLQVTVKCGNGQQVHLSRPGRAVCRYSKPGRYVVRVQVEDDHGLSDSTRRAVRVRER